MYSFGRAALLLLVEVLNHTVPVRERGRIRVNCCRAINGAHIKPYLGCQKIWGFLQILKKVITFFSFIYYSLLHPECRNFLFSMTITGAELPSLIFYCCKKQCALLHGKLLFINQCTRSAQKVSIHFENHENQSRGLDVTWQPVRVDLTAHVTSHSPMGLVSRQRDAVDWRCVLCDCRIHKSPSFQLRF